MKHKSYALGVIFAGFSRNLGHYQALLLLQVIFQVGHLTLKGIVEAVGEYVGDGVVLLLHGGVFEVEVLGELLSMMGNVLQIHQLIHILLLQIFLIYISGITKGNFPPSFFTQIVLILLYFFILLFSILLLYVGNGIVDS